MARDILLIDDDDFMVELVSSLLLARGYAVRSARDGESGLAEALCQPPGLVILDVNMPGMDGYTVTRRLAEAESTRRVPIVAATASFRDNGAEEARAAGCNGYLPKPINAEDLYRTVATLLGESAPPDRQGAAE